MHILIKLTLLTLLSVVANASEPYCTRNETTITRTPVKKTRVVVKKPTGAFRMFKKTKYLTETYEDYEEHKHVKQVHGCCDGYRLTDELICEPVCEKNCGQKATCVEPNVCECVERYVTAINAFDGSHYCEPVCVGNCPENARCVEPDICACEPGYHKSGEQLKCEPRCSSGCPFGGRCLFPEQCECADGYSAESGTCLPICTAGDGCQHGKCVAPEKCVCYRGYVLNEVNQLCEEQPCNEGENCIDDDGDESETVEEVTASVKVNDANDRMFVSASSSEDSTPINCPPNFFFYNNICRPKQFASNEFDCRFKPCVEHAFCQANGTCACHEGYLWYKRPVKGAEKVDIFEDEFTSTENAITESSSESSSAAAAAAETTVAPEYIPAICLTPAQIQELTNGMQRSNDDDDDLFNIDWMSIGVICLGALGVLCTLCFLICKLLRHRKQKMNVEGKNDFICTYDNKTYNSSPHVY